MVRIPWWFVRYGFPAAALALVTLAVVLLRPVLHDSNSVEAAPVSAAPVVEQRPKQPSRTRSARVSAYAVRSGDTLGSIADRFGTTVDRLMELNPGIDPRALRVGQAIRVG